jgi:hypothetical protein
VESLLPTAEVRGLVEKLDAIEGSRHLWRPMQRSTPIFEFKQTVKILEQEGELLAMDASFLLQQSTAFLSATAALGSSGFSVGSSVDYIPSRPEDRTHFHVDGSSTCIPATGSEECPFPSIAAALDEASRLGLIGVELDVASGMYRDPLLITRDTVIRSTESSGLGVVITATTKNRTPAYLELEDVTLTTGGPDGALNVSNEDPITMLRGVRIVAA